MAPNSQTPQCDTQPLETPDNQTIPAMYQPLDTPEPIQETLPDDADFMTGYPRPLPFY